MSLSQMTPATSESLKQTSNGSMVLLQGHISAATPRTQNALDYRLVLWTSKLRLPGSDDRWLSEDLIKHPFVVDIGAGDAAMQVPIENDTYGLATLPVVINDADYVVNGMGVGDPVIVVGQLKSIDKDGAVKVIAMQVAAGTQDDLVRHLQGSDWQFMLISAVLTVAGACVLLLDRMVPARQSELAACQSEKLGRGFAG